MKPSLKSLKLIRSMLTGATGVILLTLVSFLNVSAQQFPASQHNSYRPDFRVRDSSAHSPVRATVYSAIFPGLGQIYNQKYWKAGIVYAGALGLGYFFKVNSDSMKSYQRAVDARFDTSATTIDYRYSWMSDAKVLQERNYYRRNRDMLILGFIGLYALQIIDANVDAHLREFEINKDLSMKLDPDLRYMPGKDNWSVGLGITVRFH